MAEQMFAQAITAVKPLALMQSFIVCKTDGLQIGKTFLPTVFRKKVKVVGIGKAAAGMCAAAELLLADWISEGLCITKYGHSQDLSLFSVIESAHPTPDENSIAAAEALKVFCHGTKQDEILLLLISGGSSSLVADLPNGVTLDDLKILTKNLIASSANITEINTVRKQLSTLKGGKLLTLTHAAKVIALLLSDVVGGDIATIGSGLTQWPLVSEKSLATSVLKKYGLIDKLSAKIVEHLQLENDIAETNSRKVASPYNYIVGHNKTALEAAMQSASSLGCNAEIFMEGYDKTVDELAQQIAAKICGEGQSGVFIIGGEPTIQIQGTGVGGRNQHLALLTLSKLQHAKNIKPFTLLCAGTDGTDGPTEAAGALVDYTFLQKNLPIDAFLNNCDSYHFFKQYGGLLITGPTQTNVMDITILIMH